MSHLPLPRCFFAILLSFAALRPLSAATVKEALAARDATVQSANDAWRTAVKEILDTEIAAAETELASAKVAGNTSRQARAIATRQVYQKTLDAMEESGNATFPATIRREIRPAVEAVQSRIEALTATRDAALTAAETALRSAVRAELEAAGSPASDDAIDAAIAEAAAPEPADTPAQEGAGDSPVPSQDGAAQPPLEPSAPYASNGEATAWAPLLEAAVNVADIDIVSLPVLGVRESRTLQLTGGQGPVPATVAPLQNVLYSPPANAAISFRVLNVPGFPAPEVLEWPSESNRWNIRLRCRPVSDPDHPVSMKLEVDARVRSLSPLDGGTVAVSDSDHAAVSLDTRPSGAAVVLDGRVLLAPDGKPLRTPCEILLPKDGAPLEFRLVGHIPRQIPRAVPPADGKPVVVPLARDPNHVDKTLEVKAASAGAMTGVQFRQGRRYRVTVTGTWSCDPAKTLVGCGGYPLDKHADLYTDPAKHPRLVSSANFGALLYAVGNKGAWKPLPATAIITADSNGPLRFEINEGGAPRSRADNTGALSVHIIALP